MKSIALDIIGFLGVGLIGAGAWCIYPPASMIAVGAIMAGLAAYAAKGHS